MVATAPARQKQRIAPGELADGGWIVTIVGVFALYYVAPGLPLSLLLLATCAIVCYLQLELAVSLIPLAMPFFMLPKHLGHLEFSLGETAIVLCVAAFVLRRGLEWNEIGGDVRTALRRIVPATPLEKAIALFLIAATVATLAAHFRHVALRQYRWVILEPIGYYFLVVALLRDTRAMVRSLWALLGAGALVAVLGLGQYLLRPNTLTGAYWVGNTKYLLHLVTSVYGSPNNVGLMLDRAIPVAFVLGLAGLATTRPWRAQASPWAIYAPWLAILPMAVVLILSESRGGIVTAIGASIVAALLWRGKRDRRLELAGLGVVLVGAAVVLWKARHGLSAIARVHVWASGLAMIRDHPLLGVGPDNFLYYYFNPLARSATDSATQCIPSNVVLPSRHYIDMQNAWQEPCLSHPHNIVLDAWLSTGALGLVALALLLAGFVALARGNMATLGRGMPRAVQVAALAVVAATLAHGLVDNSIFVPDLAVAFWLALALTVNVRSIQAPDAIAPARRSHD